MFRPHTAFRAYKNPALQFGMLPVVGILSVFAALYEGSGLLLFLGLGCLFNVLTAVIELLWIKLRCRNGEDG